MHYYKILKHKAGFDEGTNYWEKLLARYLAATGGGKIHTTLPITFTSTSWKLVSWTIYGNNTPNNYSAEGTLPLTLTTQTAGNADDWSISGNDNVGKNKFREAWRQTTDPKLIISTTTIDAPLNSSWTISPNDDTIKIRLYGLNQEGKKNIEAGMATGPGNSFNIFNGTFFTEPKTWTNNNQNIVAFCVQLGNIDSTKLTPQTVGTNVVMVRPTDTSADFEPYQVGVGERTGNLVFTYLDSASIGSNGLISDDNLYDLAVAPVTSNETYSVLRNYTSMSNCVYGFFTERPTYGSTTYNNSRSVNSAVSFSFVSPIDGYVAFWSYKVTNRHQSTCVKGSTAPTTYIPYGYQIPLTVSQQGQPDKNYDIYIGDSPLTAGQSVSKASTGIDIAAIAGSNTITTDLYNKPEMSIEGVDYVGVGEKTTIPFNQWENGTTITGPAQVGHPYSDCKTVSSLTTRRRSVDIVPVIDGTAVLNVTSGYQIADIHFDKDGLYIGNSAAYHNSGYTTILPSTVKYVALVVKKSNGSAFVDGDTWGASITYIGDKAYKIPLTISQTGQTDKNYDIYIGDSPLTEGQSISNTTEIEVFEGENTIDTTLYNKPEMEIVYE